MQVTLLFFSLAGISFGIILAFGKPVFEKRYTDCSWRKCVITDAGDEKCDDYRRTLDSIELRDLHRDLLKWADNSKHRAWYDCQPMQQPGKQHDKKN